VLAAWALLQRGDGVVRGYRPSLPLVLLLLLMVIVWSRGGVSRDTVYTALLICLITGVTIYKFGPRPVAVAALDGIPIYLAVSIVGYYILGLHSPAEAIRLAGLQNTSGVFTLRIAFPFELSYVTAPIIAAVFLAALPGLGFTRGRRVFRLVGALMALFVLIAADYRGPIVIALLFVLFAITTPRLLRLVIVPISVIVFLLPFWYSTAQSVITPVETAVQSSDPFFSHSSSGSNPLSVRTTIWSDTNATFRHLPFIRQLAGYGVNGNIQSGAAFAYGPLFTGFVSQVSSISPHSTLVEESFDGGIIGVVLLLGAVIVAMRRSQRASGSDGVALAALGALAVLTMTGATETTLLPGGATSEPFWLLLMLAGAVIPAVVGHSDQGTDKLVTNSDISQLHSTAISQL